MCLASLLSEKEKFSLLKRSKKSVISGKPCILAYKVFDVKFKKNQPSWIKYSCYCPSMVIKNGWNYPNPKSPKRIRVLKNTEKYENGFHIFATKKGADFLCNNELFGNVIMVPVYFYEKDILATGRQGINCWFSAEEHPSFVVKKYFIKKAEIQKAIDRFSRKKRE